MAGPYTFDPLWAADPSAEGIWSSRGLVKLFNPKDVNAKAVPLRTPAGLPYPNPVQVDERGFAGAFVSDTYDRLAWTDGNLSGFVTSYTSLKDDALGAAASAAAAVKTVEALKGQLESGEIAGGTNLGLDVKDFGARGDSSTDDTDAIQRAIDALPPEGGAVFFPAGTYVISKAIKARNALKLFGEGNSATVIFQTMPNEHGVAGTDILSFQMEDMRIVGTGVGVGIGIMFERFNNFATNYISIKNVYVRTFGRDGIYVSNGIVSRFDTVIVQECAGNGFNIVGLNGVIGTSTTLNNCFANENKLAGYRIDTMGYMNLNGCAADNNKIGYEILNGIGLTFNGCGTEGAKEHGWKFVGGYGSTVTGGWVYANGGIGCLVTGNAIGISIIGLSETGPLATATTFVQVDAGSKATVMNVHNEKPNKYAPRSTQIFNDVAGSMSVNGDFDIEGTLRVKGNPVNINRGSRWFASMPGTVDPQNVVGAIEGDMFLYASSRDLFRRNAAGGWDYAGVLGA